MEFQRRPSAVSQLSYSETDLSSLDQGGFLSDLLGRSHFFVPVHSSPQHQRYSTPLVIISPENSTHNSTSSIPSSLATVTTNSTQNSGEATSPGMSPLSLKASRKPKKFSLNLNGGFTSPSSSPISPDFTILLDSPDKPVRSKEAGIHRGDQYINKESLAQDLRSLSAMPELCDVTFLVGEDRQPVCGVRAILAARSRVFRKMLYTDTTAVVGASKRIKKRQQVYRPSDGYIEKYDFRGQPTVVVRDFEPEVFKQLIDYMHTGSVMLQAKTLLGLMNASDHFALEELKQACIRFMERCIAVDSVCSLLSSAEKYIQFKSTKILVQKIFEFVDANAEAILPLRDFLSLPQHVVRIVLSREELQALNTTKFDTAYNWCLHNCSDASDNSEIKKLFEPFVDVIEYNKIPAKHLMQRVKPSGVVADAYILTALAYQADPSSIPATKSVPTRVRRVMTPLDGGLQSSEVARSGFRRVQSSGTALESDKQRRMSEHNILSTRDVRAGSVPLKGAESSSNLDIPDGYFHSRESEIHPLRVHDIKDRLDSQSSSQHSILSTTSFSPTHSPSTPSFHGSILSASSSDSVPILTSQDPGRPAGGSNRPSDHDSQKMPYNPAALDAIVNLSCSNVVEV